MCCGRRRLRHGLFYLSRPSGLSLSESILDPEMQACLCNMVVRVPCACSTGFLASAANGLNSITLESVSLRRSLIYLPRVGYLDMAALTGLAAKDHGAGFEAGLEVEIIASESASRLPVIWPSHTSYGLKDGG